MKKLLAKTGCIAATSALLAGIVSVEKAQALSLGAETSVTVGSIYLCETGCIDLESGAEVDNYVGLNTTPGDVGEFVNGEVRTFAEYDLSRFADVLIDDPDLFYSIDFDLGFDLLSEVGAGDVGSEGTGDTSSSAYKGTIDVSWYYNAAPFGTSSLDDPFNFTPGFTFDLFSFDTEDYNTTDNSRIEFDVTTLVQDLLGGGFNITSFGIMLSIADFDDPGTCGPAAGADDRVCSGVQFGNFDIVPTPAAVLPTLFGFASAAFRKKKKNEQ